MKTPPVRVFPFGSLLWFGYSEETINNSFRAKKDNFVRYENGNLECLRCGGLALPEPIDFPVFIFRWSEDNLEWIPHWGSQNYQKKITLCGNCDTIPNMDGRAMIVYRERTLLIESVSQIKQ